MTERKTDPEIEPTNREVMKALLATRDSLAIQMANGWASLGRRIDGLESAVKTIAHDQAALHERVRKLEYRPLRDSSIASWLVVSGIWALVICALWGRK